ncbi:MAG: hypothetical protein AAF609_10930 [Cyanobacteria bacterium P01_C01_bin.120]
MSVITSSIATGNIDLKATFDDHIAMAMIITPGPIACALTGIFNWYYGSHLSADTSHFDSFPAETSPETQPGFTKRYLFF